LPGKAGKATNASAVKATNASAAKATVGNAPFGATAECHALLHPAADVTMAEKHVTSTTVSPKAQMTLLSVMHTNDC